MAKEFIIGKRYRLSSLDFNNKLLPPNAESYLGQWGECIDNVYYIKILFDDGVFFFIPGDSLVSEEEYNESIKLLEEADAALNAPQNNTDSDDEFKEAFKQPEPAKSSLTGEEIAEIALSNSKNRVFDTGSIRDDDSSKPLPNHLDPYLRLRFGYLLREGAIKYGKGNWKLGQDTETALESLHRHLAQYELNRNNNGVQDYDHLSAIIFNTMLIMKNEEKEGIKVNTYFKNIN